MINVQPYIDQLEQLKIYMDVYIDSLYHKEFFAGAFFVEQSQLQGKMRDYMNSKTTSDQQNLERRIQAYQYDMRYFSTKLSRLFEMMPVQIVVTEDGVKNSTTPEWQRMIDEVLRQKNEYVKTNYPEFFISHGCNS